MSVYCAPIFGGSSTLQVNIIPSGIPTYKPTQGPEINQYSFNQISVACMKEMLPQWDTWRNNDAAWLHYESVLDENSIVNPLDVTANRTTALNVHQELGESWSKAHQVSSGEVLQIECRCGCQTYIAYSEEHVEDWHKEVASNTPDTAISAQFALPATAEAYCLSLQSAMCVGTGAVYVPGSCQKGIRPYTFRKISYTDTCPSDCEFLTPEAVGELDGETQD